MGSPPMTEARFWATLGVADPDSDPDACWPWPGHDNGNGGYRRVRMNGVKWLAHRLAMTFASGPIPDEMKVCHTCDNPPCCNPGHLFVGTQTDNMRDMASKGRTGTTRGEAQRNSKLTVEIVAELRRRYAGGEDQRRLADEYGIAQSTAWAAINSKTWKETA